MTFVQALFCFFIFLFQLKPVYLREDHLINNDLYTKSDYDYIAEWQWEARPVKQEAPSAAPKSWLDKINPSFWKSSSFWFIFDSKQSDVWRYDPNTRGWVRIFPPSSTSKILQKGFLLFYQNANNLLKNFPEAPTFKVDIPVVICGREMKKPKKSKKLDYIDEALRRRRKPKEDKSNSIQSLVVYVPFEEKSKEVWEIKPADKSWTSIICCENVTDILDKNNENLNVTVESFNETTTMNIFEDVQLFEEPENVSQTMRNSSNCPEFRNSRKTISWCNNLNESLEAVDFSNADLTLWTYGLSSKHWNSKKVVNLNGTSRSACRKEEPLRFVALNSDLFLFCTPILQFFSNKKLAFRLDTLTQTLENVGSIELNESLSNLEGTKIWTNQSRSILTAVQSNNQTVLIFAYENKTDLWVFTNNSRFQKVGNVFRGSAAKWMAQFNFPFYNFAIGFDNDPLETVLMINPRVISSSDVWPKERGRFFIRIINLKRKSEEEIVKEQNFSTFERLQSDSDHPIGKILLSQHFKIFALFGAPAIVTLLVGGIFLAKKYGTFSVKNVYRKEPPVVSYSVIPDDLLYQIT